MERGNRKVTRYIPSRHYLYAAFAAALFGAFSAWWGWRWPPAFVAAALFFVTAAALLCLWRCPAVEIHENEVRIGCRKISWRDIRRLDRAWLSPLIVHITLFDNSRTFLIYPGDADSVNSLLRHLRRSSREAVIDGKPYREFWGEVARPGSDEGSLASPRYRLLLPEDEAEVERLYQRLKAVRHLDPDNSGNEE